MIQCAMPHYYMVYLRENVVLNKRRKSSISYTHWKKKTRKYKRCHCIPPPYHSLHFRCLFGLEKLIFLIYRESFSPVLHSFHSSDLSFYILLPPCSLLSTQTQPVCLLFTSFVFFFCTFEYISLLCSLFSVLAKEKLTREGNNRTWKRNYSIFFLICYLLFNFVFVWAIIPSLFV